MNSTRILNPGFPTEEQIAERAYCLWKSRGCPEGDGSHDWDEARQQLLAERDAPQSPLQWIISRLKSRAA